MISWQHAVYTRVGANDAFVFSHVEFTTIAKQFPASLSARDISRGPSTRSANFETLQQATVLVMVTGKWAHHLSLDTLGQTGARCRSPSYSMYDHMERLCSARGSSKHCSELTGDYKALQYQSTLCHYAKGEDHSWRFFSVVPVLSDTVILPRLLEPTRIKSVMASFARAMRKCTRDSLIMAEGTKYRETTLARVEGKTSTIDPSEPVDKHVTTQCGASLHH
jgi:hypothetical protein